MQKYTLIPVSEIPKKRVVVDSWPKRLGADDWNRFFSDLPGGMAAMVPVENKGQAVSLEGSVRCYFKNHPVDFTPVCFYRTIDGRYHVFMVRESKGG